MKKILASFFRQLIFWLLFFAFTRVVFLVYYSQAIESQGIGLAETLLSLFYALKLDLATASYFMVLPFLLLLIQSFWGARIFNLINKVYTFLFLVIYSGISVTELGIYEEWKTKLHYKALLYLNHPDEMYNSAETSVFFILLAILLIQVIGFFWLYRRYFYQSIESHRPYWLGGLISLVAIPPFLLVGMRGGVQEIPINQSEAYYSKHNILNVAATNSAFNLYISVFENLKNFGENPFVFYSKQQAQKQVKEVFQVQADSTVNLLTTNRPNIVMIILESWSADLIESLGGIAHVTPEFHELEKSGYLFDGIYASGTRSEQGMACLFSGFPAHPISSITVQPDKYVHLPSIVKDLNQQQYQTSYYFGGQLIYGNIKSYIVFNEFDRIVEGDDFDPSIPMGKLGVHDEYALARMLTDVKSDQTPFFASLFTVSTHSPFDMPLKDPQEFWQKSDHINQYLNSAYYTDQCLAKFFKAAQKEAWYANTLFVLVADHSHYSHLNRSYHSAAYHKIPLLFYGEVLKPEYRGKTWKGIGSQADLPATLLKQLDLDAEAFRWSKDLLNPSGPQFASVAFEEGIGWIRPYGQMFYDKRLDRFYQRVAPDSLQTTMEQEGKSYLQVLFQEYMDY